MLTGRYTLRSFAVLALFLLMASAAAFAAPAFAADQSTASSTAAAGSSMTAPATSSTATTSASTSADKPTTVKVGYFYNAGYLYKDDDGVYRGFDVEYLYTLAGYANLDIQFIDYSNLKECLDGLERGDIDMVTDMAKTSERESRFVFSNHAMSSSHIAVMTRNTDDRYQSGDPSTLADARVAILKNTIVITLYENWCAQNGLTPHVVEYDSIQERNAALASGEVDAIAAGSTIEGTQRIAEIPSQDLYCLFNVNRTALKTTIDQAMGALALDDPNFTINLREKYFPASKDTMPTFSAKEKSFLAAHPVLKVAVLRDNEPFSSQEADGSITGILPDYYNHLSDLIGTSFEYVAYDTKADECAAATAGDVDLVGMLQHDAYYSNEHGLILSQSYLDMNMVQVTRAETTSIESAATIECTSGIVADDLKKTGSSMSVSYFANGEQCFEALNARQVDAVLCPQPMASWFLINNRMADYSFSSFGTIDFSICAALPAGEDGNTLRIIIDKALAVDSGYAQQLIANDTLKDSASLTSIIDRIPVGAITAAAIVFFLIMAVAVFSLIVIVRRRKRERELEAKQAETERRATLLAADERANEAQRSFFSTVSHDMRTPLNGIIGFADLALASDDPAKTHDYLGKIRTSGSILTDLVNDTLIMSRVESGKLHVNPIPCDNRDLIESVCASVRVLADEKGITFAENLDGMPRRVVMADRVNLQKVLLNLLSNAVKFTPAGGTVTLTVALEPPEGSSPDTVFSVEDTGIGISEEFLPHLFEPFTQEDAANAGALGTGLGLSIVKSLVEAMGGTVAAESVQGKGSRFTVRLHLEETDRAPVAAASAASAHRTDDAGETIDLAGREILVCEDNAMNLEIVRTILEKQGVTVVGAGNGREGLDAFESSSVDTFSAVLLDLRMPVMDGIETAKALRALDRPDAKTVPMIAVSADAYAENVQDSIDAGMDDHVAKPIDPAELLATLNRCIRR